MLSGKIVIVTGGTGAIGAAIVRAMAAHGADVAFTYNRQSGPAEALASEVRGLGRRCLAAAVEGTDGPAIEGFVGRVEEGLGEVEALVNNIGIIQVMPFALVDADDWDRVITVNLKSMFLFTKAVVRHMVRRRRGAIVNLGSIAGHRVIEVPVHYATAKAGVVGFTTSLAKELGRYNIRVNAVAPGLVEGGIGSNVSDRQLEDYKKFCAAGRAARPHEIAELVAFAASDRATYVNGQTLVADGGL